MELKKWKLFEGNKIISEGNPIEYIWIVKSGEFEIHKSLGKDNEEDK